MNIDKSKLDNYIRIRGIWRAPRDYILPNKLSYRKKVFEKIKSCRAHIAYLKQQIDNPNYTEEAKEYFFYSSLKEELISLRIFEKQASFLAA